MDADWRAKYGDLVPQDEQLGALDADDRLSRTLSLDIAAAHKAGNGPGNAVAILNRIINNP